MTEKELISQCRYYRGQDECPFHENRIAWFWEMERLYVMNGGEFEGEREYYETLKGKKYSGIPYPLLLLMFTSWGKYTYDIKNYISHFYEIVDFYLDFVSDHLPIDKIPNAMV